MIDFKFSLANTSILPASPASELLCELDDIGEIETGSLEEAIWAELGALPRSRMISSLRERADD